MPRTAHGGANVFLRRAPVRQQAGQRGASLITFSIRYRRTGAPESSSSAATLVSTAFNPVGRLIAATRSENVEGNALSAKRLTGSA